MPTTTTSPAHVLLSGVLLPACCRPQSDARTANCPSPRPSPRLLHAQLVRVNAVAGLSYVVWQCTSHVSPASASPDAALQPRITHSKWVSQQHVTRVDPAPPDTNVALRRGPHDSKFDVENPLVALWRSRNSTIGRFTVATERIRTGQRAFQAAAFAVIVRQAQVDRRCHWCFVRLCTKAVQCADCAFARYCSRDCLSADAMLHDFQCPALRDLKSKKDRDGGIGDVETVRLALAVLSMEQFVRNPDALKQLVVHCDAREKARHAVEFIVTSTGRSLDRKHVCNTLERVRCNAHPLYVDGVTCVGSGVFPDAAMALNHSCLPNVAPSYDPRTRTLAFHAITDILPGHAVECAYIDLLQTTTRRQALLSQGFGFTCVCIRCTNEGALVTTDGRAVVAENDEKNRIETQVMAELMQLNQSSHAGAMQRLSRLKIECADFFQHNHEARFALYTVELQLARGRRDWKRVVNAAEMLLTIWTRCGLPANYHTTETLYMQIYCAAKRAGMADKEKTSALQVTRIRQICGYVHPETMVG
ncbi:unnamed protein product [Hyaloperonospora brassicae]|uniref:MYND-type domain-containing protein n=1 Tax=Hyaloperonospora brassicae TaxID=162125 RepID=A0AAV0UG49_HYABA|nr:unnamed protein product [Hyaloperonospora brassicae]